MSKISYILGFSWQHQCIWSSPMDAIKFLYFHIHQFFQIKTHPKSVAPPISKLGELSSSMGGERKVNFQIPMFNSISYSYRKGDFVTGPWPFTLEFTTQQLSPSMVANLQNKQKQDPINPNKKITPSTIVSDRFKRQLRNVTIFMVLEDTTAFHPNDLVKVSISLSLSLLNVENGSLRDDKQEIGSSEDIQLVPHGRLRAFKFHNTTSWFTQKATLSSFIHMIHNINGDGNQNKQKPKQESQIEIVERDEEAGQEKSEEGIEEAKDQQQHDSILHFRRIPHFKEILKSEDWITDFQFDQKVFYAGLRFSMKEIVDLIVKYKSQVDKNRSTIEKSYKEYSFSLIFVCPHVHLLNKFIASLIPLSNYHVNEKIISGKQLQSDKLMGRYVVIKEMHYPSKIVYITPRL